MTTNVYCWRLRSKPYQQMDDLIRAFFSFPPHPTQFDNGSSSRHQGFEKGANDLHEDLIPPITQCIRDWADKVEAGADWEETKRTMEQARRWDYWAISLILNYSHVDFTSVSPLRDEDFQGESHLSFSLSNSILVNLKGIIVPCKPLNSNALEATSPRSIRLWKQ